MGFDFQVVRRQYQIAGTAALAYFAAIFSYTLYVMPNTVRMDQWRMVTRILGKYYDEGFSFAVIGLTETAHPHMKVGSDAFFLLNALLFDLNVNLEIFIGLICLLAFTLLLLKEYHKSLDEFNQPRNVQLAFLLTLIVIFSMNRSIFFYYSLLAMPRFVGWLLFLLSWRNIERSARYSVTPVSSIALVTMLTLIVIGFSGGRGPSVLGTCIAIIFLHMAVTRNLGRRSLGTLAVVALTAVLLEWWFWSYVVTENALTQVTPRFIGDPAGATEYVLTLFANSAIHQTFLKSTPGWQILTLGAMVATGYLSAIWLYFRHRMWRKSYLPMAMIIYTAFYIGALLTSRFGTRFGFALRPSYAGEPGMGLIGMIWIFTYVAFQSRFGNLERWRWKVIATVVPVLVISIETVNIDTAMGRANMLRNRYLVTIPKLKAQENPRWPVWYCRANLHGKTGCDDALAILKEHKLNIYSD